MTGLTENKIANTTVGSLQALGEDGVGVAEQQKIVEKGWVECWKTRSPTVAPRHSSRWKSCGVAERTQKGRSVFFSPHLVAASKRV